MFPLLSRYSLFQTRRSSETGTQRATVRARQCSRLYLEALECRCVPSTVTNLTDHDPGSLRDAIATTPAGGTVDFEPRLSGTITLTSGTLAITKDLTIALGLFLTGPLTVSGNHTFQVFNIAADTTVTISGLTVADGVSGGQGGGIYNAGTLTLEKIVLLGNTANATGEGGGIFNSSSGTLTLISSTVSGNAVHAGEGGGVYNDGALRMINSIVSGNRLSFGTGAGVFNGGLLTIDNSSISGNSAPADDSGGGITNNGTLAISNSTISGNGAYYGGGIKSSGTLMVSNTTISGNIAEDGGGLAVSGSVTISASVLSNNFAEFACALLIDSGNVTVSNSTISGNRSGGSAAGGTIINGGTLTISNTTISGNRGTGSSGGIDNFRALTISSSMISGNAGEMAGGIQNRGTASISSCTISGNMAGYASGILNSGTLTVSDSTVSGNTGGYFAGAIANLAENGSDANAVLLNSTIANNTTSDFSQGGSQLYSGQETGTGQATVQLSNTLIAGDGSRPNVAAGVGGSFVSHGHNLSTDNASGFLTGPGDLINTSPLLGPLQDNGGPTQTMAILPGSPALDAGDNTLVPASVTSDQRGPGYNRIMDGTVDMGAFEAQAVTTVTASPTSSLYGQVVTFTATVVSEGQSPNAGTVVFWDGNTALSGPVAVADGQARFSTAVLSPGMHRITAFYSATPAFYASSGGTTLTITPAPLMVTTTADSGPGSLRDAIAAAPAGGTVQFLTGLSGTISLNTGALLITQDVTITGPGAGLITVSGNHAFQVFRIAPSVTVTLSGLTIANGSSLGTVGGGISNEGTLTVSSSIISGNYASPRGGGIFNGSTGTLLLSNSTVTGNSAANAGGGIFNDGALTVSNCTFSGNGSTDADGGAVFNLGNLTIVSSTFFGNGGTGAYGGAVRNDGVLSVEQSTFSRNEADLGGAIYNVGTLIINHSTFSGNRAMRAGGGIESSGTVLAGNTILAGNAANTGPGPDLYGVLTSLGHNLIGSILGGSGFVSSDLVNRNPLLAPLQDNGGPTPTMALLPGSPAIDAGDPSDAPEDDQRGPGYPRIVGDTIDIGAYEFQEPQGTSPAVIVHRFHQAMFLEREVRADQSLVSISGRMGNSAQNLPQLGAAVGLDQFSALLSQHDRGTATGWRGKEAGQLGWLLMEAFRVEGWGAQESDFAIM